MWMQVGRSLEAFSNGSQNFINDLEEPCVDFFPTVTMAIWASCIVKQ